MICRVVGSEQGSFERQQLIFSTESYLNSYEPLLVKDLSFLKPDSPKLH
jgi:hypothetical protein